MKYNRSEIMKAAWSAYRRFNLTFAEALRKAWYEAKVKSARYTVIGERFRTGDRTIIRANCTYDEAGEAEWLNKCRFDRVSVVAA